MQYTPPPRTIDFPSLLSNINRSGVGFDYMFDHLHNQFQIQNDSKYPPHDIIKYSDTKYMLTLALAGFKRSDLTIKLEDKTLTVSGLQKANEDEPVATYMHRGISARAFERTFTLAEHAVISDATYEDGLLSITIDIEVPDQLKPRIIDINSSKRLQTK